jgi:hypothetical protein
LKIELVNELDSGAYTCRICNYARDAQNRKSSIYQQDYDNLNSNEERDECDERSAFLKVFGKSSTKELRGDGKRWKDLSLN